MISFTFPDLLCLILIGVAVWGLWPWDKEEMASCLPMLIIIIWVIFWIIYVPVLGHHIIINFNVEK
jgi:hypothetical protein